MENQEAAWWLAATPGWGAVKLRQLTSVLKTSVQVSKFVKTTDAENWYGKLLEQWKTSSPGKAGEVLRITQGDWEKLILHGKEQERWSEIGRKRERQGIRLITVESKEYPQRLLSLYDRPFALYVRGRLPEEQRPTAAVIGARACSAYGGGQGKRFARELAACGVQIISGLAYGVDSEGHWGALESGAAGATYAVLGCGVDQCYPPEHEKLADQILANGGGLISEFLPGTGPKARNFPMRNRIISGLSDCILVMEARKRSGSLITVDQALEQGKEVFALPGRVCDGLSEGCHQLIRNGAAILTSSEDVLEFLYPDRKEYMKMADGAERKLVTKSISESDTNTNPGIGKEIYCCLDTDGKTIEQLMSQTGLSLAQVQMELLDLLMEDKIVEPSKGYYSLPPY